MDLSKFIFELEKLNINESIEDKGILKGCFMAGNPGAGKSYSLTKIKSGQIEPRIVNTDKFVEFLGKELGLDKIAQEWGKYGKRIKQLNNNQLAMYLNSLLPLWIDGTSSSPNSVFRRQGILKSIGYDTAMIWVETSLETALKRNRQRDRQVPDEFIEETYEKIQDLKPYYKSEFKNFFEIRNDEGELNNETILEAYRKVNSFFNSDVENPIGKKLIKEMRKKGHKYLIDTEEYEMKSIKRLVSSWCQK